MARTTTFDKSLIRPADWKTAKHWQDEGLWYHPVGPNEPDTHPIHGETPDWVLQRRGVPTTKDSPHTQTFKGSGDTEPRPCKIPSEYVTLEGYHTTLQKWLSIEDIQATDIMMAVAISVVLPGDPLWLFVIAPAGGSKTEQLRAYSGDRIFTISTLTPQTLISGLKGFDKIDLLPNLDGKVLVIKDFTSILSKKPEDQTAIFADLREAYDGYLEKSFGSGV